MPNPVEELCEKLRSMEDGESVALLILDYLSSEKKKYALVSLLATFRGDLEERHRQVKLTKTERAVYELVKSYGAVTIDDVIENLGKEYDALKYRTHASDALNSLVRKGLIGKIAYGKKVLFLTPEEAVIQAMKDLDMLPTKCNLQKIADHTNLPIAVVLRIIEEMI